MINKLRKWFGFRLMRLGMKIMDTEHQRVIDFIYGVGEREAARLIADGEFWAAFTAWREYHHV